MSAAPTTSTMTAGDGAGQLGYELARYTVSAGERILYGQRTVNGEAILIDLPAGEQGRVYLVERALE
jgi:hypothetical protein